MQTEPTNTEPRWHLYRLLSEPVRLRLLALAAEEELSVGELAELLGEPQPNVSRHAAPLRQAGILADRRDGTRTLVRLADHVAADAVIVDALSAGRQLCTADGSLARVPDVVARRDARAREFFAQPGAVEVGVSPNLPAYLHAFGGLLKERELAVDAGTGDGVLLDILAPLFERVVALDRSAVQLARAKERVAQRGYRNVELLECDIADPRVTDRVGAGADLVVAARVLHHAPRPRPAFRELAELARPGGTVLVIDYAPHDDEHFSERLADLWLGFSEAELRSFALDAGLLDVRVTELPRELFRTGPDAHLSWIIASGTRSRGSEGQTNNGARARKNGKKPS